MDGASSNRYDHLCNFQRFYVDFGAWIDKYELYFFCFIHNPNIDSGRPAIFVWDGRKNFLQDDQASLGGLREVGKELDIGRLWSPFQLDVVNESLLIQELLNVA